MRVNTIREAGKLSLRKALQRSGLGIVRDPSMLRLVRTLDALAIDTVLDVGANSGQFASLLRSARFGGRIISFEPLPDAYRQLVRRARKDPFWQTRNCALGERNATMVINVSRNSYSSSLLPITDAHLEAAAGSRVIGGVEVAVTTLADLATDLNISPTRTMLKIDAQGYESRVLDGAGDVLELVAAVQLELSTVVLYSGQQLFDDLRTRLEEKGLSLFSMEPGIADRMGRMLQCDGLFVRESQLLC